MKALNISLIALMLLSLFAGFASASAETLFQVPVATYSANNAAIIADTITAKNSAGVEVGKITNVQTYTFLLPAGEYTLTATKAGYTLADAQILIESLSPAIMPTTYLKLAAIAQPSQPSQSQDGTQMTSADVAITDVDFNDEAKANEALTFDIDVKNSGTYDAENIQVTVTILNIDDGEDLDQTEEFSTLDVKEKDTYTVGLTIPKEVDAKKYSFEVKVEWEDADGNEFYTTKAYTDAIEVTKEKHDVQITAASFLASSTEAGKSNQASVSLWNAGKEDETVKIKIEVPDLKISTLSAQFKLNENDESTQYMSFAVPSDAKAGKYFAYATVYFNSGSATNMEMLTFEVKAPAVQTSDSKVTVTPVVVTTQTETPKSGGFGGTGLVAGAIVALLVLAMLFREFAPQFAPKPTIIKATRGGR